MINIPEERNERKRPTSRALEIRRDNDYFTTPKISIYDVDYSILYWLKDHLKLEVKDPEGNLVPVPVIFSSGESWAQVRQFGFMRDNFKKIMTPLIMIRRVSMRQNEQLMKLDGNRVTGRFRLYPYKNLNNKYDQLGKLTNTKQSNEFYLLAIPEYYKINYEITIWTDFVEQINDLVHEIIVTNRFTWGDTLRFTSFLDNVSFETINPPGENRVVKASMDLEVDGILMREFEAKQSTVQKSYSVKRLRFENERSEPDFILYNEDGSIRNPDDHIFDEKIYDIQQRGRRKFR